MPRRNAQPAPALTDAQVLAIVRARGLEVETLKVRNSDSLDFIEVYVADLEQIVKAAFAAGLAAR